MRTNNMLRPYSNILFEDIHLCQILPQDDVWQSSVIISYAGLWSSRMNISLTLGLMAVMVYPFGSISKWMY